MLHRGIARHLRRLTSGMPDIQLLICLRQLSDLTDMVLPGDIEILGAGRRLSPAGDVLICLHVYAGAEGALRAYGRR